ncbi:hypothetical protein SAY86_007826 [Trapa natans]|uniref:Uncharacterized protein n=1 Tax=Trapa natans TaxID=22666 RepID=A0AAN7QY88_TRANT|nr:hypothetical protein SAY86_007826 [Trapa natans]
MATRRGAATSCHFSPGGTCTAWLSKGESVLSDLSRDDKNLSTSIIKGPTEEIFNSKGF